MKRSIIGAALAVSGLLALAGSAQAADADKPSPMAGAFGNTIVSVNPDGSSTKTYLEPDGSYRSVTPAGTFTGRWAIERARLCYHDASGAPPLCTIGPGKKVGDKWKIFLESGSQVKVEIVAGRS